METSNQPPKQEKSMFKKILGWFFLVLFAGIAIAIFFKYFFVFGEGVKSGELNYAVKKGNIFKTYEGKLIQEGIRTQSTGAGLSSNEFEFSIANDSIYQILESNSGKSFDLHYKEYHGVIPWRGNTRYIVDKVVEIREAKPRGF
ncbi:MULTISPECIES: hypothetical protein [Sphingobacterium]|uniref:6-phosphogluconate dehydrogenase n=1 Tax=Sphingobacterium tenebrionis TaxID=3111775 RepID=A0ABU8I2J1_9SPHI|nr:MULTISPECIES: hypothetical protein [unclassified Sphingobacterium]